MGVTREFAKWIKERIEKYGFVEGIDYEKLDSPNSADQVAHGGDRKTVIYRITLDMAKQLAMVENSVAGRLARRYFIWTEDVAHRALVERCDAYKRSVTPTRRQDIAFLSATIRSAVGGMIKFNESKPTIEFRSPIAALRHANVTANTLNEIRTEVSRLFGGRAACRVDVADRGCGVG